MSLTCPECGTETEKTGNRTIGNTPEVRCPDCSWRNTGGFYR